MSNDRFKFRVWDENRKIYPIPTDFLIDYDGNLWEQCTPIDNSDNHLIIEQCTGLRDKNGKLIFEGDVVKCDLDNRRKNLINQVVSWNGCFSMDRCGIVRKRVYEYYNIEIIGNLHEYERD